MIRRGGQRKMWISPDNQNLRYTGRIDWSDAKLRSTYPKAEIICMTTLLGHDAAWDRAIGEVVEKMKDDHITHYLFKRNGCGTRGHLRIPEASEMAVELSAYIESRNVEGWE